MTTSPDLTGWSGLQGQIGAGEGHRFGFSFLGVPILATAVCGLPESCSPIRKRKSVCIELSGAPLFRRLLPGQRSLPSGNDGWIVHEVRPRARFAARFVAVLL